MNRNQGAALANPNLEFGASTFLGQPVGPNQLLLVFYDRTEEEVSYLQKALYFCHDGADFPQGETQQNANLELAVIPSNLKALQRIEEAFAACAQLKTVIGLEDLEEIPAAFCVECGNLKVSRLNATVINDSAFVACVALTRVELPNVKDVHSSAFNGCTGATIVLNDNVVTVGESAFADVDNLIYHGNLKGAPWGAKKWNGVPQS